MLAEHVEVGTATLREPRIAHIEISVPVLDTHAAVAEFATIHGVVVIIECEETDPDSAILEEAISIQYFGGRHLLLPTDANAERGAIQECFCRWWAGKKI